MKSPLHGPKVLLLGKAGTGKTYCIQTLVEAGIVPYIIGTESLAHLSQLGKIPAEKLHWKFIQPPEDMSSILQGVAKEVGNAVSFKILKNIRVDNKAVYTQFHEGVWGSLRDFVCDRDNQSYGNVYEWGTDRAIVIDSLTGVSRYARLNAHGAKPSPNQEEWGVAMTHILGVIQFLTTLRCHVVVIGHISQHIDMLGSLVRGVLVPGQKLAPEIGLNFTDIIHVVRRRKDFFFDTLDDSVETKAGHIPFDDKLIPSFVPLIEEWKARGGIIESSSDE